VSCSFSVRYVMLVPRTQLIVDSDKNVCWYVTEMTMLTLLIDVLHRHINL